MKYSKILNSYIHHSRKFRESKKVESAIKKRNYKFQNFNFHPFVPSFEYTLPYHARIVLVLRLHFRHRPFPDFSLEKPPSLDRLISQHRSQLDSQSRGTAAVHLFCGTMCHPIFFPHDRFSTSSQPNCAPSSRRLSPVLPCIKITYVHFFLLSLFSFFFYYSFHTLSIIVLVSSVLLRFKVFESKTFCK